MKIKNNMIGLMMAFGATITPFMVKANTETKPIAKTVEVSKAEKASKLKKAIELGLPKEELLKYIDFPEWMPVTKDGKFDEKQAGKMFNDAGMNTLKNQAAFLDYKTAVEKGANSDVEFQKFAKQITGGNPEQMQALNKIKDMLKKTQETHDDIAETLLAATYFMLALSLGLGGVSTGTRLALKEGQGIGVTVGILPVVASLALGMAGANVNTLNDAYNSTFKQVYNVHVNQEIQKAATPKVVQMDMQQTKQFIETAKQNTSRR